MHVLEATADQMFNDITPALQTRMPQYKGDLELINHSAGSLTSQAYHKRWVMKNEMLADAAEKASVAAVWLGARDYPTQRINDAWTLALGGHFHDTAAGTATPRTYEYAWNDDVIVANQFAGVLTDATEAVAAALDTQGIGTPLVVSNALNIEREDLVEAKLSLPGAGPVSVTTPSGETLPAQMVDGKILFSAKMPSVGYAVYRVTRAVAPAKQNALKVTVSTLENEHYLVKLNPAGDVASIYDKDLGKELLAAPMRLAFSNDAPRQYPAWNMDFEQEQAAPVAYVEGPVQNTHQGSPDRSALRWR